VLEIDEAVAAAMDYANARGRTLVVVTGDHDTGGLQVEDSELLPGLLKVNAAADDIAARLNADRTNTVQVMADFAGVTDLTPAELDSIKGASDAEQMIGIVLSARVGDKWTAKGHTATPVPVFAFGPGAGALAGPMDNTDIPKRIAKVLGIKSMSETAEAGTAHAAGAAR
jgi:alkaline phosphatase